MAPGRIGRAERRAASWQFRRVQVDERVPTVSDEPIIAIGLLTRTHLRMLSDCLPRVFPVADDGQFDDLLAALDRAEANRPSGNGADLPDGGD